MSVTVSEAKKLKQAITDREDNIIIEGKLAETLKPLKSIPGEIVNKIIGENFKFTRSNLVDELSESIPPKVIITLVLTLSGVIIVDLLKEYSITFEDEVAILEKKS